MSPRTLTSAIAVGLVLVLAPTFSLIASAQTAPPNYSQLQRILQQKFAPAQQPLPLPRNPDRRDFRWIAPRPIVPNDRGEWHDGTHGIAAIIPYRVAANSKFDRRAGILADATGSNPSAPPPSPQPSAPQMTVAQQTPVARRNTYIIQLKPDAKEEQISDLLHRYNLNIIRVVPGLGLLRVEHNETNVNGDTPLAVGRQGLEDILNPQIVQDLRKEAIVDSAAVDATLSTKSIPKAAVTTVANDSNVMFSWHWQDGLAVPTGPSALAASTGKPTVDGNWGLKAIHMPPVWTIIQRYRAANPLAMRPKLAFVDTGFADKHEDLTFNALRTPTGDAAPSTAVTSSMQASCDLAHGNHVAGIAGAVFGNGIGIDGVVPQAKIDAVTFTADFVMQNADLADVAVNKRLMLFWDVVEDLWNYLQDTASNGDLRVVNISLGFNFIADGVFEGDPDNIDGLKLNIAEQAKIFANLARLSENSVLFVVAAGNDSANLSAPLDAKWSSPMAWAATQIPDPSQPKNILIVEAHDRNGQRAAFSNINGHVAAPGVDILSTMWPGDTPYGVCSGTSQASPHVAGLATLLFELDPTKKPADIANIIKASATKPASGAGAPRIDAFDAVLALSPDNLTRLADLNNDGKVDALDLAIFARQIKAINDNRANGTVFTEDLNGDGIVDANECSWPLIDLNGSGTASLSTADARTVQGTSRTDLQVMELAWTDKTKSFSSAMHDLGLDTAVAAANAPTATSQPSKGCR
jgi:subtilisin family serine protease